MATEAQYPVKEIFPAMNALRPTFEIADVDHLYVDFDQVRSASSLENLMFQLGIINGALDENAGNAKILFTGHTGSGKSTELLKLHHRLNKPKQYLSVYLDIEDYIVVSEFKSEDLIVFLIAALVNALEECEVDFMVSDLKKITEEWLNDEEVVNEVKSKLESEIGVSAEVGTPNLLKWFSAKVNIKSFFSYNSNTARIVRRKIQEKQGDYIIYLNNALREIKVQLRRADKGNEIVFLLDGLEKLRWGLYDTYNKTFTQNTKLISELNSSLVCCVPIDTVYDWHNSQILTVYSQFTLPLIPINTNTSHLFSQIITRRIDHDTFFEDGVLDYCVAQSGGSPRQLITIVYTALTLSQSNNFKINTEIALKACKKLGLDLWRRLSTPHVDLLESGNYDRADETTLDLLYSLSIMEYNGEKNNREPNPLLKPFLKRYGAE